MAEVKKVEATVESRQKEIKNEKLVVLDEKHANSNSDILKESDEN